jgi:hypothetical protein
MTSTPEPRSSRRWRWGLLLALLAFGAVVAWLLQHPSPNPQAPVAQTHTRPRPATVEDPPSSPSSASPASLATPTTEPTPAPPVVDEILVEKPEVCSGEDNLITVRAHTTDGNDAYLHYTVGDGTGQSIPLRVWRNDADGSYELPHVTVFTRDNVSITVPVPAYQVKDCEPDRLVQVMSRRLPNSEEDFEFFAQVMEQPVKPGQPAHTPFVPVRYVWTFDGEDSETTQGPIVPHTLRSHTSSDSLYTQHLIRVEVYDASGHKETGRSSLQLLDTSFENLSKKGVITLLASGTPRFPVLDEGGVVRQTFRLYHHFRGPVHITRVTTVRAFMGDKHGPPPPEQVDSTSLPVSEVPEGQGTEVKLTFDTHAEPNVFSITYALEGVSTDGHPARGTFSIMRPPPRPTRDNSTPITDPVLLAKVKRAREVLHQEYVTDEDLFRLEREGRFANLKVEDSSQKPNHPVVPASGELNGRPRNPAR